jgi:hypothetical protein
MSVDCNSWEDYINGEDPKEPDWDYIIKNYAEEQAEDKASLGAKYIELEVKL